MLKHLFKKSLLYFVTLASGKLLSAVYFMIVARVLLPERFGEIMLFTTLVQLITTIADVGLKNWYLKMMATDKNPQLLAQLFSWRMIFYLLSAVAVTLIQSWRPLVTTTVFPYLLIALWFESLVSVADGFYLARGQSLRLGFKLIARNVLLFVSLSLINSPADTPYFYLSYIVVWILVLAFYFPWSKLAQSLRAWWRTSKHLPRITATLPYAAIDNLGVIYSRADQLIINQVLDSSALGIYGAAYRYLDAFNLLPQALFHNLFPLAAKKGGISRQQIVKMVAVMTSLGIAVAAGMVLFSNLLTVTFLGPDYAPAAHVLRLFAIVVIMFFFNATLNTILQSSDQVKNYVPFLTASTIVNIVLNLLLVPRYGMDGSVYAMIAGEGILVIMNVILVHRFTQKIDSVA